MKYLAVLFLTTLVSAGDLSLLGTKKGLEAREVFEPHPANYSNSISSRAYAFDTTPLAARGLGLDPRDLNLLTARQCDSGDDTCSSTSCCPSSSAGCCGLSSCCPSGTQCINSVLGYCCDEDQTKCGDGGCYSPERGQVCCGGLSGGYCNEGETCCGTLSCCPSDSHCENLMCVRGGGSAGTRNVEAGKLLQAVTLVAAWMTWHV